MTIILFSNTSLMENFINYLMTLNQNIELNSLVHEQSFFYKLKTKSCFIIKKYTWFC